MRTDTLTDLKQLMLTAWKERWSERKWSTYAKRHLINPLDIIHVADVLVSQAYVGTIPNPILLGYINYALNTGMLSYGSVINAITKHEDLHKIESTRKVYELLENCLFVVNKVPLVEDAMNLCCSLRRILQWLLHNTEQYLQGVRDVHPATSNELIKLNCHMIEQLTTKSRTSALLTIARFEESGVWSSIETDLVVVNTSAAQHALRNRISDACHHVEQLSRYSIGFQSVYPRVSSSLKVFLPVSGFLVLEVEKRAFTDPEGLACQLILLSRVHDLSMSELLSHIIQTCVMGFLDAVLCSNNMEHDWSTMLLLRVPKIFTHLRSLVRTDESEAIISNSGKKTTQFEQDLLKALHKLSQLDSLWDALDQLNNEINWLKSLSEHFLNEGFITDIGSIAKYVQTREEKMSSRQEKCRNPFFIIKTVKTVEQLIATISLENFSLDAENLKVTFQRMCNRSSFIAVIMAAAASGQLPSFANKLIQFNDDMKASGGETPKTAQIRAALYDLSFLIVCFIVKIFGQSSTVLGLQLHKISEGSPFFYQWLKTWWIIPANVVNTSKYETDPNRVDLFIKMLRTSTEFKITLTKWQDVCLNLPQAVLSLIVAKQKGVVANADLNKACALIRDGCPLCVNLATVAVVSHAARLSYGHADHVKVLEIIAGKSQVQMQGSALYNERYNFFRRAVGHLASDLLPDFKEGIQMCSSKSAGELLQDTLIETRNLGWLNHARLEKFQFCLKYLGIATFTRHLFTFMLQETRLDMVETSVDLVFTIMRVNTESFIIYLLKNGIHDLLLTEPRALLRPVTPAITKMIIAFLDIALNDCAFKRKLLLQTTEKVSPFLYEATPDKNLENSQKVRRLLSRSTEHDLGSSSNSLGLPSNEPLVAVLADFIHGIWKLMKRHEVGVLYQFVFTFVKGTLYSSSLLSHTVKQLIPVGLVKDLSSKLVEDSQELLFAASDLGNQDIRRIAAKAICLANNLQ